MPATAAYYQAVGRAVWTYTGLEWGVVCVLWRLWPDYVAERYRLPQRPPGKRIHADWITTIPAIGDADLKAEMEAIEPLLKHALERRNDFFHASPATFDNNQILIRMTEASSIHWTSDALDLLINEFDALSRTTNKLLHSERLKQHGPIGNWKERALKK